MTYSEFKKELLKRIDPAYSENSTYQAMAERAFLDALRTALLSGSERDFYGFIFSATVTSSATFDLATIKASPSLKDFVKIIKIKDASGIDYLEKTISEFYDAIKTRVKSFNIYYTYVGKALTFSDSTTATIYYYGIPAIGASDDMGIYMTTTGLEQVAQIALPMLSSVIGGSE